MVKKKYFGMAAVALLVFFVLGYLAPALLITDGTEQYDGERKAFANDALDLTEMHLSTPSVYRLYATKLKVASVIEVNPKGDKEYGCSPYVATIHGYTFFGIQKYQYEVADCGGVSSL